MAHAFSKEFCPVDANGDIVAKVASLDELNGLAVWFNNPSQAPLRQKAYEKLGGGKASLEAKGKLFSLTAGAFFHEYLLSVNAACLLADNPGIAGGDPADAPARHAKRLLSSLLSSFREELFGTALIENAKFTEKETQDLIKLLKIDSKGFETFAQNVLQNDEINVSATLETYWTDPKSRAQMLSGKAMDPSKWGIYAPFLSYMSQVLTPQLMAELMTKLDLYVRSGWHAEDLRKALDGEKSPMAELLKAIKERDKDLNLKSFNILNERFSQLFLKVRVNATGSDARADNSAKVIDNAALRALADSPDPSERERAALFEPALAGPGEVDAVILSPDKQHLFVSFATSNTDVTAQGDQWIRHAYGILNGIRNKVEGWSKAGVSKATQIHFDVAAPAALSATEGKPIHELFETPLPPETMKRLRLLPFFCTLLVAQAEVDEFAMFTPKIAGADTSDWLQVIREARQMPKAENRNALLAGYVAKFLADTFAEMDQSKIAKPLEIKPKASSTLQSWFSDTLRKSLTAAIELAQKDTTYSAAKALMERKSQISHFVGAFSDKQPTTDIKHSVMMMRILWENFCKHGLDGAPSKAPKSKGKAKKAKPAA